MTGMCGRVDMVINNAINFASSVKGIIISKADEEMILHCQKSFLFREEQPWTKIGLENFGFI